MSNVQGEMRQFKFGLEPIIEFMPRLLAALEIEFKSAGAYLILRRIVDHHESPRHQRDYDSPSDGRRKFWETDFADPFPERPAKGTRQAFDEKFVTAQLRDGLDALVVGVMAGRTAAASRRGE
jgi:hypothetical protein